ncbi:hypothetical protein [Acinetobacter bereziniae]|nr:hypothetical protein [Acinetobacter bereziniae]
MYSQKQDEKISLNFTERKDKEQWDFFWKESCIFSSSVMKIQDW